MKRINRDHPKFDLMRMLDRFASSQGVSIRDEANHADFLANIARDFEANRSNDILIHGLRIQAMFAYVAAALGNCSAIKEEDAGDVYAVDSDLRQVLVSVVPLALAASAQSSTMVKVTLPSIRSRV